MLDYEFLPGARADLDDILARSAAEYGQTAATRYADGIEQLLGRLCRFPDSGTDASELGPGLRSAPVGRHRLYYRRTAGAIRVVRILHQAMLPHDHLGGDD